MLLYTGLTFDGNTPLGEVVERVRVAEEEAITKDIPFDALLEGVFPVSDVNSDKRAALFQVQSVVDLAPESKLCTNYLR